MLNRSDELMIRQALFGREDYRPLVSFYDHAVPDAEATEKSGRPRFRPVVYVRIKPTSPDLSVRDVRARLATEKDRLEYAPEWARYLAQKDTSPNRRPPLSAIPGMTVDANAEFNALNLRNCADLAAYAGDVSPWEQLRETAQAIMRISDGLDTGGQQDVAASANGSKPGQAAQTHAVAEGWLPTVQRPSEVTFSYQFTA